MGPAYRWFLLAYDVPNAQVLEPQEKKKKAKPKQFEEKLLEASLLYVQAH